MMLLLSYSVRPANILRGCCECSISLKFTQLVKLWNAAQDAVPSDYTKQTDTMLVQNLKLIEGVDGDMHNQNVKRQFIRNSVHEIKDCISTKLQKFITAENATVEEV